MSTASERAAAWNREHPERHKELADAYAHSEHGKAIARAYYEDHRKAALIKAKRQREQDPEAVRAYNRAYYERRQAELKAKSLLYAREHPEVQRAARGRRKARGNVGMDFTDRLLSVEYRKAISEDPCFYCGATGEEDDHYVSLANGGTDHWYNLVRACGTCNRRKGAMNGDIFKAVSYVQDV